MEMEKNNNFSDGKEMPKAWLNRLLPSTEPMKDVEWQTIFGRVFFLDDHGVFRPLALERAVAGEMSHYKDLTGLPYNVGEILQQFAQLPVARIHHYAGHGLYLRSLFDSRTLVDVVLHVQDKVFAAHRVALACHSLYFARAFLHGKHHLRKVAEVRLRRIDPLAFSSVLRFIYTGQMHVHANNLDALLNVAHQLQIPAVLFKCLDFMGHMPISRTIDVVGEPTPQTIEEQAKKVLTTPLGDAAHSDSFLRLGIEAVEAALGHDDVLIEQEMDVFNAAIAWLAHDVVPRRKYLDRLMRQVRFTCMSAPEVIEASQASRLICASPYCRNRMMEAIWLMTVRSQGTHDVLKCSLPTQRTALRAGKVQSSPRRPVAPQHHLAPHRSRKVLEDESNNEISSSVCDVCSSSTSSSHIETDLDYTTTIPTASLISVSHEKTFSPLIRCKRFVPSPIFEQTVQSFVDPVSAVQSGDAFTASQKSTKTPSSAEQTIAGHSEVNAAIEIQSKTQDRRLSQSSKQTSSRTETVELFSSQESTMDRSVVAKEQSFTQGDETGPNIGNTETVEPLYKPVPDASKDGQSVAQKAMSPQDSEQIVDQTETVEPLYKPVPDASKDGQSVAQKAMSPQDSEQIVDQTETVEPLYKPVPDASKDGQSVAQKAMSPQDSEQIVDQTETEPIPSHQSKMAPLTSKTSVKSQETEESELPTDSGFAVDKKRTVESLPPQQTKAGNSELNATIEIQSKTQDRRLSQSSKQNSSQTETVELLSSQESTMDPLLPDVPGEKQETKEDSWTKNSVLNIDTEVATESFAPQDSGTGRPVSETEAEKRPETHETISSKDSKLDISETEKKKSSCPEISRTNHEIPDAVTDQPETQECVLNIDPEVATESFAPQDSGTGRPVSETEAETRQTTSSKSSKLDISETEKRETFCSEISRTNHEIPDAVTDQPETQQCVLNIDPEEATESFAPQDSGTGRPVSETEAETRQTTSSKDSKLDITQTEKKELFCSEISKRNHEIPDVVTDQPETQENRPSEHRRPDVWKTGSVQPLRRKESTTDLLTCDRPVQRSLLAPEMSLRTSSEPMFGQAETKSLSCQRTGQSVAEVTVEAQPETHKDRPPKVGGADLGQTEIRESFPHRGSKTDQPGSEAFVQLQAETNTGSYSSTDSEQKVRQADVIDPLTHQGSEREQVVSEAPTEAHSEAQTYVSSKESMHNVGQTGTIDSLSPQKPSTEQPVSEAGVDTQKKIQERDSLMDSDQNVVQVEDFALLSHRGSQTDQPATEAVPQATSRSPTGSEQNTGQTEKLQPLSYQRSKTEQSPSETSVQSQLQNREKENHKESELDTDRKGTTESLSLHKPPSSHLAHTTRAETQPHTEGSRGDSICTVDQIVTVESLFPQGSTTPEPVSETQSEKRESTPPKGSKQETAQNESATFLSPQGSKTNHLKSAGHVETQPKVYESRSPKDNEQEVGQKELVTFLSSQVSETAYSVSEAPIEAQPERQESTSPESDVHRIDENESVTFLSPQRSKTDHLESKNRIETIPIQESRLSKENEQKLGQTDSATFSSSQVSTTDQSKTPVQTQPEIQESMPPRENGQTETNPRSCQRSNTDLPASKTVGLPEIFKGGSREDSGPDIRQKETGKHIFSQVSTVNEPVSEASVAVQTETKQRRSQTDDTYFVVDQKQIMEPLSRKGDSTAENLIEIRPEMQNGGSPKDIEQNMLQVQVVELLAHQGSGTDPPVSQHNEQEENLAPQFYKNPVTDCSTSGSPMETQPRIQRAEGSNEKVGQTEIMKSLSHQESETDKSISETHAEETKPDKRGIEQNVGQINTTGLLQQKTLADQPVSENQLEMHNGWVTKEREPDMYGNEATLPCHLQEPMTEEPLCLSLEKIVEIQECSPNACQTKETESLSNPTRTNPPVFENCTETRQEGVGGLSAKGGEQDVSDEKEITALSCKDSESDQPLSAYCVNQNQTNSQSCVITEGKENEPSKQFRQDIVQIEMKKPLPREQPGTIGTQRKQEESGSPKDNKQDNCQTEETRSSTTGSDRPDSQVSVDTDDAQVPYFKVFTSRFGAGEISGRVTGVEVGFRRKRSSYGSPENGMSSVDSDLYVDTFAEASDGSPSAGGVLVVGGYLLKDGVTGSSHIQRLDLGQGKWEKLTVTPKARLNFAAACLNGKLYVVGGYDPRDQEKGCHATADTMCFNPRKKRWKRVRSMVNARSFHALCCLGGRLYAVGGQDEDEELLSSAEVYDPRTDRWTLAPYLTYSRVGVCCASFQGRVVVAGGYGECPGHPDDPCAVLTSTEWLDPASRSSPRARWELGSSLRFPRAQATMAAVDRCLFLCGGVTRQAGSWRPVSVADVDQYDADSGQWTHVTNMQTARHNAGAVVCGDKLLVVGGVSTCVNQMLRSVERYDLNTSAWDTSLPDLPRGAKSVACALLSGAP